MNPQVVFWCGLCKKHIERMQQGPIDYVNDAVPYRVACHEQTEEGTLSIRELMVVGAPVFVQCFWREPFQLELPLRYPQA
jgi:hypothetical protein